MSTKSFSSKTVVAGNLRAREKSTATAAQSSDPLAAQVTATTQKTATAQVTSTAQTTEIAQVTAVAAASTERGVSASVASASGAFASGEAPSPVAVSSASASAAAAPLSVASLSAVAAPGAAATPFLPRVAFLGRGIIDYREMFALPRFPETFVGSGKRVLDVAAGSAAFASEAMAAGAEVVAVDPLYDRTAAALAQISQLDLAMSYDVLGRHPSLYRQSGRGLELLRARREQARAHFLADYPVGLALGRYRKAALPHLPFDDDSFDLALCGNFLFLYAHLFDADFHRRALDELLRVAKEVRVYPLFGLDGSEPPFLGPLLAQLQARGLGVRVQNVNGPVLRAQARVLIVNRD